MSTLCELCQQSAPHQCSRCLGVYYCGVTCQHKHWSTHKKICKPPNPKLTQFQKITKQIAGNAMIMAAHYFTGEPGEYISVKIHDEKLSSAGRVHFATITREVGAGTDTDITILHDFSGEIFASKEKYVRPVDVLRKKYVKPPDTWIISFGDKI